MAKNVRKIEPTASVMSVLDLRPLLKKKRVAAYARVSTEKDEQQNSYDAQIDYYTALIQNNPEWEFVDIYSDEGITGTSIKNRDGFNRMIDDALAGKIDLILTKSVSRFARNTVDSLTTVRKLKEKGIEVYFEKENIYTLDAKGELLITIMSSLAQEESRSISQNTTWGQRKRFADGKMSLAYSNFLGYRRGAELGDMEIVEEEAIIVRRIYSEFLAGKTPYDIAKHLTEDGIPTPMGKTKWHTTVIESILKNEKYKGDALLQKTVTTDFLTHTHKRNEGEAPQFYVEKNHPAIVRPEVFEMVQEEFRRRKAAGGRMQCVSIFSGRIVCEDCGGFYGRKVWHSTSEKYRAYHWHCNNKFQKRCSCQTPTLKEESIEQAFLSAINSLIKKKKEIRENYALCLDTITDDSAYVARLEEINAECCRLQEETKSLLTAAGRKNGGGLREINRQYEDYLAKFEGLQKEKSELSTQISKCAAKRVQVSSFLEELQKYDGPLKEFDPLIWQATLNHAVVHKNCTITFVFRDGTEVTRKIKNGVRKYVKRKASDPDNPESSGEKA